MQNIDIYYESLRQVYEQIINWPERKPPLYERIVDGVIGIIGVFVALSFIPIIPAALIAIGGQVGLSIGPINLKGATIGTFIIIWLISFFGGLMSLFLILWVNSKVVSLAEKPAGPPQTLSPEQLTFIAIYESYKELKVFFVSHVEQHVRSSYKALRRILVSDVDRREYLTYRDYRERELVRIGGGTQSKRDDLENDDRIILQPYPPLVVDGDELSASFPRQIEIARYFLQTFEKYSWFQLDIETKATLQALISFSEKVPYRLKQKEDLPAVLSILENLSKFTYAYLPEHKTYMETSALEKLQAEGAESLQKFTKEANDLTPYRQPEKPKETKAKLLPTLIEKLQNIYYGNVFVRFTIWFMLILSLTAGAVFLINQRMTLSPDTIASLVIGTSVVSAAALAGFLPRSSKPK